MQITNSKALLPVLIAASLLLGACNVLREATGPKPAPSQDAVFGDLVRYSDMTVMRVSLATREFAEKSEAPDAELQAARWKLDVQRHLTQTTGGPNSLMSLLDTVVLVTVTRWLHEDYWLPQVYGEAERPILVALEKSEHDGWLLLDQFLDPALVKQTKELLDGWRAQNKDLTPTKLIDYPNFNTLVETQRRKGLLDTSVLGMVGLDPLENLEPMARQVELSRMLGLRALYFAQRAPRLVGSELDERFLSLRETPEVRRVLSNLNDVSESLKSYAATGEKLPEIVRTEREGALKQASEELTAQREGALKQIGQELTAQREGIVRDLTTLKAPLDELLRNSQAALGATEKASTALTGTVTAVDGMLTGIAARSAEAPKTDSPPSKPFDPADYGAMADHVGTAAVSLGGAAKEVTALLGSLDQRLPEVQKVLDETAARGDASVDHALRGALLVGLVLIAAASVAAVLVRRVRPRSVAIEVAAPRT